MENIKDQIKILTAALEGKELEYENMPGGDNNWIKVKNPLTHTYEFYSRTYRIKTNEPTHS